MHEEEEEPRDGTARAERQEQDCSHNFGIESVLDSEKHGDQGHHRHERYKCKSPYDETSTGVFVVDIRVASTED